MRQEPVYPFDYSTRRNIMKIVYALLLGALCLQAQAENPAPSTQSGARSLAPCPPIGDCDRRNLGAPARQTTAKPGAFAVPTAQPPLPRPGVGMTPSVVNKFAAPGSPDLYVRPKFPAPQQAGLPSGFPSVGYCGPVGANGGHSAAVWVVVRNKGLMNAAASTLRVSFTQTGTVVDLPTPALNAGQQTEFGIPIPPGCFNGPSTNCNFSIAVDPAMGVAESDEQNNTDAAYCTSAAT